MSPDLKAKWLEALRSGRFKQGHNKLKNSSGGFCCLGVLCVVAGIEISEGGEMPAGAANYDRIHALGIPWDVGRRLVEMNDGNGYASSRQPAGFPEIADYIERTL